MTTVDQRGRQAVPNVKHIIAVASGKGGVGKSTTAVNLALALAAQGARTGLLDADIYGPNQPTMLGVADVQPKVQADNRLLPVIAHGVQSMSIGYLVAEEAPMIWRGPMVVGALQQLLYDTQWDNVDYLVIDLPPGTGDIQLTLAQKIPVNGVIIVTTPQDVALLDVRKAINMFEKVRVPILGVVENMAVHVCSACGHAEHVFGQAGGAQLAEKIGVELLGSLPLDIHIRQQCDAGKPSVVAEPNDHIAQAYHRIGHTVREKLTAQPKDYSVVFPKIVVE